MQYITPPSNYYSRKGDTGKETGKTGELLICLSGGFKRQRRVQEKLLIGLAGLMSLFPLTNRVAFHPRAMASHVPGSRLAPPTRSPSTPGAARRAGAFAGLTLPP